MIVSDVNDVVAQGDGPPGRRGRHAASSSSWPTPGVFYSTDGEILRAMQRASGNGATIMMHAENGIAIDVLVAQALARGETDPRFHGLDAPRRCSRARRRTARSRSPGSPARRSTSCTSRPREALDRGRGRARPGPERVRRDLPAVPVPDRRGPRARGVRGREVRLLAAAARPASTRPSCGAGCAPTTCRSSRRTTARSASRNRRSSAVGDFSKIPNGLPGVEHRIDLIYQGVVDGEISLAPLGRDRLDHARRGCSACTRRKGVIAPGSDADIVVYDPERDAHPVGVDAPHERRLLGLRGRDVAGRATPVLSRGARGRRRRRVRGRARARASSSRAASTVRCAEADEATVDFGLVAQTNPPARDVVELAKRAEDAGFTHFWTFDSTVLWQEPFVIYSQILAATTRIKVGPMVTNPADARLDGDRVAVRHAQRDVRAGTVCGIGRGDSAVRVTGGTPASLATLGEAIGVIKDLAEGREVDLRGTTCSSRGSSDGHLDVWMAAYGPKALDLVGERGPTGSSCSSPTPSSCNWAIDVAREAARAAAARPGRLHVCVAAPAYVGDDLAHQRDQCAVVRRAWWATTWPTSSSATATDPASCPGADRLHQGAPGLRLHAPRQGGQPAHRVRARRDHRPLLRPRPGPSTTVDGSRSSRPRRRPVRPLPDARRPGGDDRRLRHPSRGPRLTTSTTQPGHRWSAATGR